MRAVVQRVCTARITVDAEVICEMGAGLLALVGVGREDTPESARELARRIVGLRVFNDDSNRMNRSLLETGGTLGVVSQFTLFGDARHGRRPSYVEACPAERAAPLIEAVVEAARDADLFVVEASFPAAQKRPGHLVAAEAGRLGREAGARRLLLTHFYPEWKGRDPVAEAGREFPGEVLAATDGMRIQVEKTET